MPDKPTTVVAYAAGASLAAIAAFYVFGPTFFLDGENSSSTNDGRKRTIIGLANPANDCFINSVLQALAGLGDLRLYLIRELHRRQLDDAEIYNTAPPVLRKGEKADKLVNLQKGPITRALKDMIDALNERPIYRKTITARPLIEALERAFQTRISRNQQDAQEFLQIVLERLCDEYHAAERARNRLLNSTQSQNGELVEVRSSATTTEVSVGTNEGFPFEGRMESQIRCLRCQYKTKPSVSTFVSLTLNVPQKSSTTLDSCFDILLKSEEIDDFRCDKCRLQHALEWKNNKLKSAKTEEDRSGFESDIERIEHALREDPEKAPEGATLPDPNQAPKSKIRKSTRITVFPKLIAIHLSRSLFDPSSYSTKNMAKVSYSERLRLGGLLEEKWYKLLGVVCHKGSHHSGHYESFRRFHLYPPFATPDPFSAYAMASRTASLRPSATASPNVEAIESNNSIRPVNSDEQSNSTVSTASLSTSISRPNSNGLDKIPPSTSPSTVEPTETPMSSIRRTETQASKPQIRTQDAGPAKFRRRKKSLDRWWRISDDKIKEARTSDVLSMQREVYLLFYELERPGDDALG
ncbi:ubiquitin thiolesterase [Exophiala viscosa]|uniref:Ubiquitin carboxyl-terminal hydrolase n=1 Tax=Exophiala viscosa TaxID=2486360 RepID=A0AAN6E2L2_9EURO|nr:ubiquitin thiolesterase [Exophiala viscosa]